MLEISQTRAKRWLRGAVAVAALVAVSLFAVVTLRPVRGVELGGLSQRVSGASDGGPVRFLKGQTHAHSNGSGDSETPLADVARWYAQHGFDFVVVTDHNVVTPLPSTERVLLFSGVELTQNPSSCRPAPLEGLSCVLHVNALFVDPSKRVRFERIENGERLDVYAAALDAAAGLGADAQINHPNFHFGADAQLIGALVERGARYVEIANNAIDSNNEGDATHPSTEAQWDEVLSNGHRVWGTASDDAHHYDDAARIAAANQPVFVGDRGFVMVRASKTEASIRDAMRRGDFYASTGVMLKDVRISADSYDLELVESGGPYQIQFIGPHGKVLASGESTHFSLLGLHGYVRAKVTGAGGAAAWAQPAFIAPEQ